MPCRYTSRAWPYRLCVVFLRTQPLAIAGPPLGASIRHGSCRLVPGARRAANCSMVRFCYGGFEMKVRLASLMARSCFWCESRPKLKTYCTFTTTLLKNMSNCSSVMYWSDPYRSGKANRTPKREKNKERKIFGCAKKYRDVHIITIVLNITRSLFLRLAIVLSLRLTSLPSFSFRTHITFQKNYLCPRHAVCRHEIAVNTTRTGCRQRK